uniref:Omp85 domain-containing protein n=1 Tax=Syphacia muris TaxID=451379 RepID=A0A0N5AHK5_9BILA
MKDLDEVGDLVGGGNSAMLSILRPYYSMVEMAANGNRQGVGSYMHVLPDEEYGDKPIYSVGASFSGGIEPAGMKHGFLTRAFG